MTLKNAAVPGGGGEGGGGGGGVFTLQPQAQAQDGAASCLIQQRRPGRGGVASAGLPTSGVGRSGSVAAGSLRYTLLGAFVFLAIEGGGSSGGAGLPLGGQQSRRLHGANSSSSGIGGGTGGGGGGPTASNWLQRAADESRARTVENIWDITVSLNILYRDNWTRLAAQEIARFQEQLVQRLGEEAALQQRAIRLTTYTVRQNLAFGAPLVGSPAAHVDRRARGAAPQS
ncbi:tyrosine-protein kinase Abl-like [Schistocerca nitens]|uniref:tyrosine-protein kinase Abl-like n=1 Tax=Schistocerca nitens TaxID=7011 RepID=UPI00211963FA|nr:tyrosine-protein kinase Abl-like [Schistocerca nitens]